MDAQSTEPSVRPAERRDAAAIAHVHVTTWREAYRGIVDQGLLDGLRDEDFVRRWTANLSQQVPGVRQNWVATLGGEVVGFGSAGPCRDEDADRATVGEIYAMYVLPSAWRSGAGTALMREILGFLRGLGRSEATLWVLTDNERARRFYERCGMAPDGATRTERKEDANLRETRYRIALEVG